MASSTNMTFRKGRKPKEFSTSEQDQNEGGGSPPLSVDMLEFTKQVSELDNEMDEFINEIEALITPTPMEPKIALRTPMPMEPNINRETLIQKFLEALNNASGDELKRIRGIGEKRVGNILQLRESSSEPFKTLDDLKDIGLSTKQVNKMLESYDTHLCK